MNTRSLRRLPCGAMRDPAYRQQAGMRLSKLDARDRRGQGTYGADQERSHTNRMHALV